MLGLPAEAGSDSHRVREWIAIRRLRIRDARPFRPQRSFLGSLLHTIQHAGARSADVRISRHLIAPQRNVLPTTSADPWCHFPSLSVHVPTPGKADESACGHLQEFIPLRTRISSSAQCHTLSHGKWIYGWYILPLPSGINKKSHATGKFFTKGAADAPSWPHPPCASAGLAAAAPSLDARDHDLAHGVLQNRLRPRKRLLQIRAFL